MDQPTAVLAPVVREPLPVTEQSAAPAEPSRPSWPGILSFVLAVLTLAGLVTGLVLVVQDRYEAATLTAWVTTGVGVTAAALAIVAWIGRWGRGWAVAGLVLAVIANPPVLTWALATIGGLWA
jgi:hypothetical protein